MDYERQALKTLTQNDFLIETLGPCEHPSPLIFKDYDPLDQDIRILFNNKIHSSHTLSLESIFSFEAARPYPQIFFNTKQINVGVVTCGGLCPGINDVVRSITYCSRDSYQVKNVFGFPYGFQGLTADHNDQVKVLTDEMVDDIHEQGGTILASSRGGQSVVDMVDTLVKFNISILFVIGGDGSQRGSMSIVEEIKKRKLRISVIGIPKTIDNDIAYVNKTFGFDTAVEKARGAIHAAHVEAKGAFNGIGLVKLMGRHSGFIAAHATLSSGNVNMCLIPEEPFNLPEFLDRIEWRFKSKDHVVIVVAEGVGQEMLRANAAKEYDNSGNEKLLDIGIFLREQISSHLRRKRVPHSLKYIDPSYMIRSVPANATDSSFCLRLGNYAVHAGMSGRTNCLVGYWNQNFTLVPNKLALSTRKTVDVDGPMWNSVKEITFY